MNDQALAVGESVQVALPVGTHQITLIATDLAGETSSDTVSITVVSAPPTIPSLLEDVMELVENGVLTPQEANGLIAKLRNALASLNRGNIKAACNQLAAFINQVNDYVSDGLLTVSEGDALNSATSAVRSQIPCA